MTNQDKMLDQLFPLHLFSHEAKRLCNNNQSVQQEMSSRFSRLCAEYQYSATVRKDKTLELVVTYTFDDGFAMGGGTAARQVIELSGQEFDDYLLRAIMIHSERQYEKQQDEKRRQAIAKIAAPFMEARCLVNLKRP